ncbi:MAG: hypothetical protein U0414_29565 [Polyangiaceae bacterium]
MGLGALGVGAAVFAVAPRGVAGPAAAPSASASPRERVAADPVDLAGLTIPEERSPLPGRDEWASARPVLTARSNSASRACSALLLREYLKIECAMSLSGIRQFAGPIDDVALWVTPFARPSDAFDHEGGGYVVVPLRRGEGHLFRFFRAEWHYGGDVFPADGPIVDAYWPRGDAAPTVTIR